jgi:hypothetical protein
VLSNNAARAYFFLLNTAVMVKTEPHSVKLGNYRLSPQFLSPSGRFRFVTASFEDEYA